MEKQGWEESEKRKGEERISEKRKSQKKEDAGRAKVETSRTCAFPMFAALENRKVGSLKQRVLSHMERWEMKNWTPLWRTFRFEMWKTPHARKLLEVSSAKCTKRLGSGALLEVEMLTKVHSSVARSAFRSQTCKKLAVSENFLKLRCRKSARVCGARHMSASKCESTHVRTS